ncbi:TraR/DksA C4-type zinc finger protein [Paenibacillus thiaminolyticus]|uniref:TraR/DksA C4-type zinc finger protein n=1 Tax=Paenibacillus thiaminolyticus TaxID=49283 RepID=UPI00232FC22C|nr:TraR/DksA C4-type zinc finger protein [Paenibacillus thiaminolyticus]WCF10072.1 TraR/DksA C4-type zinc finger protein [Paenibacillus thiaminolyticus]
MNSLTSQQLESLKQTLLDKEAQLSRKLSNSNHYGLSRSLRENTGELSNVDNHPGDVATEMYERGKDIALNEHDEFLLDRIHSALAQIDKGTYGICAVCKQPIPYERLEAVPFTMYCIEHEPQREVSDRRPVEEQFLMPPFGRTSLDELDTQNGFDGEDAWQIVESWGTSNTPAMQEDGNIDDYDNMYIEASDDVDGFVESFESFVATDMTGSDVYIVRNRRYRHYMDSGEGEPLLEPDETAYSPDGSNDAGGAYH